MKNWKSKKLTPAHNLYSQYGRSGKSIRHYYLSKISKITQSYKHDKGLYILAKKMETKIYNEIEKLLDTAHMCSFRFPEKMETMRREMTEKIWNIRLIANMGTFGIYK